LIDEVEGADSYTKYVIEECTESGTIESYYTCADASCSDCTLEVFALAPIYANRSDAGICYNYTYSTNVDNIDSLFDPSTSFTVQTEFIVDLDDIEDGETGDDLEDITTYVSLIVGNSCIDDGTLVIVDEDELIVITEEGDTTVVPSDIVTLEPQKDGGDECITITDLYCESEFTTVLCTLITTYPEVVTALQAQPYTLFAPIDDAFAEAEELLNSLSDDEVGDILYFHAYVGSDSPLAYDDLVCMESIVMANGYESRTKCDYEKKFTLKGQKGGGNRRLGKVPMIITEVETCGGIVHVIDSVMLPNWVE